MCPPDPSTGSRKRRARSLTTVSYTHLDVYKRQSFAYALKEGTYYYTVSADEYQTKEGSFTVPVSDNRIDIELSPVEKYDVTFDITCGEQVATIKLTGGGKVFAPAEEGGMRYQLADGAYQYEVAAPGYICLLYTSRCV